MFIKSKFTSKHLFTQSKAVTLLASKSFEFGHFTIILVSLANNIGIGLSFTILGRSLINIRINNGPKIDP